MTEHQELQNQVYKNTNDIADMKADVREIKVTVQFIRDIIDKLQENVTLIVNRQNKTTLKLTELGPVKLVVFSALGIILTVFFSTLVTMALKNFYLIF